MANRRLVVLAGLAAVLAAAYAWDTVDGRRAPSGATTVAMAPPSAAAGDAARTPAHTPARTPAQADASRRPEGFALVPLARLGETTQRPLFAADRRPPPAPESIDETPLATAETPSSDVPELGELQLTGVVAHDDGAVALLRHKTSNSFYRLRQGDTIKGWLVERIDERRVVLVRDGIRDEIYLIDEMQELTPVPADQTPVDSQARGQRGEKTRVDPGRTPGDATKPGARLPAARSPRTGDRETGLTGTRTNGRRA